MIFFSILYISKSNFGLTKIQIITETIFQDTLSLLLSQEGPLNPGRHLQLSPLGPAEHVPPFLHIVERQCSSSRRIE